MEVGVGNRRENRRATISSWSREGSGLSETHPSASADRTRGQASAAITIICKRESRREGRYFSPHRFLMKLKGIALNSHREKGHWVMFF